MGGVGKICEINESIFPKVRHLKGKDLSREDIRVFWIVERDRSVTVATYSLCGFANMASVGLQIACLSSLAPNRAKLFPKIGFYAMIAGNMFFIKSKSQKGLDDLQQCQGIKKMLTNDYPKSVSLCFILVGLVLGLTAIGLQIYSIIKQTPLYYIGTG
ncbi:H+ nucleoside cotransporter [Brachionus plicatilis]|uniref:H+ nucleoside cotransporter n=1 Tax=Brachionus plicatilis TaxID=10195 RepID=A0A3M7PV08_BRAPC|nr:H+ nucleoside cotransporter [Brachionus plicatilis]